MTIATKRNSTGHIGHLTQAARLKLWKLDWKLVGTEDYMGFAYFWNHEYHRELNDATPRQRQRIHHALLQAGLWPGGKSMRHTDIIRYNLP